MVQSPFTRPFGLRTFPKTILSQEIPRLLARTIYPDSTGKMILPTEARTTDLYPADHEGVYRLFKSGEPAVVGGRVVRNLVDSVDPDDYTKVNVSITDGVQDKDGGNSATRITATSGPAYYRRSVTSYAGTGLNTAWVRRVSGTGAVTLVDGNGASGTNIAGQLTSEWKRFSAGKKTNATTGAFFVGFVIATSGDSIEWCFPQHENVTGQSDQDTPSEFVTAGGYAVYATENGNSVASNVVTEAVGSALSPAPYVLTTPGATNSCAYSQDLTGTGWSGIGSITKTRNEADIFGNSNSAWTIEDTNGSGYEGMRYSKSITSSANTHSVTVRIKKTVSASSFPGFSLGMSGGSSGVNVAVAVNTDNGTITARTSFVPDDASIVDDGEYWKVTISHSDTNSGNTSLRMDVYPAVNTDASSTWVSSATGSCVIDQAEIFLNTPHAVAHALPPIPTSGSSSMIGITKVNEAISPTRNFVLKFYWTPEYDDQGTVYLIGNYTDANNAWAVLHDGTNIIFRNRVSGSNNDATKALNYVVGTEYEITIWHDDATGLHIGVDDTEGTLDSTTTDVTSVAATYIGQNGNNASAGINGVRDVRYWEGRASSWSQVTGLTA